MAINAVGGPVQRFRASTETMRRINRIRRLAHLCAYSLVAGLMGFGVRAASLEWIQGNGFRSAALPVSKEAKTGFTLLSPASTGINFTNVLTDEKTAENQ